MINNSRPKLSVIIPIFNEAKHLETLVQKVMAVPIKKEIILVDDASTDGTGELIHERLLPAYPQIRLEAHKKNSGKGSAIRSGLRYATGDIVIIQDADLEYNPMDYLPIVKAFDDCSTSVVYGTRFQNIDKRLFVWHWFCNRFLGTHYEIRYLHHFMGIQLLNLLANLLYSANITDEATCYKAFRREVLDKISLKCTGFEFCPEFTAKIRKAGYKIAEVPISYHPRSHKEGKKLNWRHGFEAVYTLIKYRLVD